MRTEPCKQCGSLDFYIKGKFSYCRPCHTEAQKRYYYNKRLGITKELKGPPVKTLDQLLSSGSAANLKLRCANGHPMTGDNVRLDTQANGKNLLRRCRTCERNAKRVTYGLAPEPAPVSLTEILDELT